MNKATARDKELSDITVVMATESGRRFLYRQLVKAGIYRTSYDPESPEKHIFFKEGMRNTGLWLLSEIEEASPSGFLQMLEESKNVD